MNGEARKLGKINTGKGLDMMLTLLPYMQQILSDPELAEIGEKIKARAKGETGLTAFDMIAGSFPVILKNHKNAMYGIVSTIMERSEEEIAEMPLEETLDVFSGAFGEEILGFFMFCTRLALRT